MKTNKTWTAALCLGLMTLVGGSSLSAADKAITPTAEQELQAKMKAQGWKEISKGVYERQRGANKFEHLGYGAEGLTWTIGELNRQIDTLMQEYLRYPSEDLYKTIDRLRLKVADSRRDLVNMKNLSISDKYVETGCSLCYSAVSDAYPLSGSSGQGVGAIADASFNSSCGYSGTTDAYAYARANNAGGTTTTLTMDDPHTGVAVTSHAAVTVNGVSNCLSTTSASVISSTLGISYTTTDSNSTCPGNPLTVLISGTSSTTISGTNCLTLTWTAVPSGGSTPYTYSWLIDGISGGTGSSASHTYCGANIATTQTVHVSVTVHDSSVPVQTSSPSYVTTINYLTSGGPCSVISLNGAVVQVPCQ